MQWSASRLRYIRLQQQHQNPTCQRNYTTTVWIIFLFQAWAVKQEVKCIFAGQVDLTSNRCLQISILLTTDHTYERCLQISKNLCHCQQQQKQNTGKCQALLQNHSAIYTTERKSPWPNQRETAGGGFGKLWLTYEESAQCLETLYNSISKGKTVWSWFKKHNLPPMSWQNWPDILTSESKPCQ